MSIQVLRYLVQNKEELIRESANENKLNEDNVWVVAQKIVGQGNLDNLSEKQMYLYENALLPLRENVPCQGWFDEFDGENGTYFDCPSTIENERLLQCYELDSMLCESCEEEEGFRAARKAAFMRD